MCTYIYAKITQACLSFSFPFFPPLSRHHHSFFLHRFFFRTEVPMVSKYTFHTTTTKTPLSCQVNNLSNVDEVYEKKEAKKKKDINESDVFEKK